MVNLTGVPMRSALSCSAGTAASSRMLPGSMMVKSGVPGCTTSPALTGRALTMPDMGAEMMVLDCCFRAWASRVRASASCACPVASCVRASSRSRSATAPAWLRVAARSALRRAELTLICADLTPD
jgi:hypothetical protein